MGPVPTLVQVNTTDISSRNLLPSMEEHKNKPNLHWIRPTSLSPQDSEESEYYTDSKSEKSDFKMLDTFSQRSPIPDTDEDSYGSEVKPASSIRRSLTKSDQLTNKSLSTNNPKSTSLEIHLSISQSYPFIHHPSTLLPE